MILAASIACTSRRADEISASGSAAATTHEATGTVPHGDHNPHHGGVVMMKGDLHYEVVLDPTGRSHQIYFTDAVREDLPAATASSAHLTIKRRNERDESIPLRIDDAGESWVGRGREVRDPASASATVSFTIAGEPYSIDIPFIVPSPTPAKTR
jgi:hypothetical protein